MGYLKKLKILNKDRPERSKNNNEKNSLINVLKSGYPTTIISLLNATQSEIFKNYHFKM